jgi:hypothetical protein
MDVQTRTKSYPGLFRSQAEEAFRLDAVDAVAHGWQPTAQHWNGTDLVVTYAFGLPTPVAPPPPQPAEPVQAPARRDSAWAMLGAVAALVALGAITGIAVSGQGPFGAQPPVDQPGRIVPYVPPVSDEGSAPDPQAPTGDGTSCRDWDGLSDQRRFAMSESFLATFRREDGQEPASPPDEDVYLMMGILDAMCADPGTADQPVAAVASLVWMSEALED